MSDIAKTSEIKITIGLDQKNIPQQIQWQAQDNPAGEKPQECKAILLSLCDRETLDTLKIDLWTADMQVGEMDRFFYQTLRALTDTYFNATQNQELANEMQRFVQYFGEKTEVIPKT